MTTTADIVFQFTHAGLSAIRDAVDNGLALSLSSVALGDGNRDFDAAATALLSQKESRLISFGGAVGANQSHFQTILPVDGALSNYWVSEIGLFGKLNNGAETLIALASVVDTRYFYRAASDQIILPIEMAWTGAPPGSISIVTDPTYAQTKAYVDDSIRTRVVPPGAVMHFCMSTAPTGWLICDGSVVSRTTYAALFAAINTMFNTGGEGMDQFRLPDLRGEFIRGLDGGRGADAGRALGSWQVGTAFMGDGDGHNIPVPNLNTQNNILGFDLDTAPNNSTAITVEFTESVQYSKPLIPGYTGTGMHVAGAASTTVDFARTRPRNVALLPCIKT